MKKIFEGNNKFIVIGVVVLIGIVAYIMPNKNKLANDVNLDGAVEIPQNKQKQNKERPTLDISEDDFSANVIMQKEAEKSNSNTQANTNKKPEPKLINESDFKPEIINNQTIKKEEYITNKGIEATNKVIEATKNISNEVTNIVSDIPTQIDAFTINDKNKESKNANNDEIVALKAENAQLKNLVAELKNEIEALKNEIAMLKSLKIVKTNSEEKSNIEVKVVEEPKISPEELKRQEELIKQQTTDLEKLSKELNFYKPELKIINGKLEFESVLYKTGDVFLSRYKIEKITNNSVRFSRNGQFYNLRF